MSIELIVFIAMVGSFLVGCFAAKLPVSISMVLASIIGALVGGQGIPLRHLVEGTFSYVDTILVIATAMIFMKVIQESGTLEAMSSLILEKFHRVPALLLCMIMLVIMFPGMITGSSTASVLTAGSIMAPILMLMGVPLVETGCILAMGGVLGMIAPPVNIPAMIIGAGIDIPYVGFELPLALMTFPLAFLFVLMFGLKHVRRMDYEVVRLKISDEVRRKYGFRIYLPLIVAVVLMVLNKAVPAIPDIGMPLVFLISAFVGLFTGKKVKALTTARDAIGSVLPVLGILMGVGMFIQVMTLTGVRGLIVTSCLSLPDWMRYVALSISVPAFGAVSAFGSASVLGVPFLLSMLGQSQIITCAAISLISGLGDMVPPTALAGMFAAQVIKLDRYSQILKKCVIPCLIIIVWGLLFILFSNQLAPYIILK
ncbi:MAG: TRAP transporter large permease subunit [Clostridiales bacterium]|nr:TRAP transporter large permease subunit [Clostridiales bacterium]